MEKEDLITALKSARSEGRIRDFFTLRRDNRDLYMTLSPEEKREIILVKITRV